MNSISALVLLVPSVFADIPAHCLRSDVAGQWQLHMSHPVARGQETTYVPDWTSGGIAKNFCGLSHPNKNSDNLALNIQSLLEGHIEKTMYVDMTENVMVHPDMTAHMRAFHGDTPEAFKKAALLEGADTESELMGFDSGSSESSWTTTYDEGWELRLKDKGAETRLFALAKYHCTEDNTECGKLGANEDKNAVTRGYQSECGKTLVGWFNGPQGMGCFYGQKHDEAEANKIHSYVVAEKQPSPAGFSLAEQVHTVYHQQDFGFQLPSFSEIMELHKSGTADMRNIQRAGSVKRVMNNNGKSGTRMHHVLDECAADDLAMSDKISLIEAENPIFDWRKKLAAKWDTPVADQGSCGSCYTFAMNYAIQSRNNIALLQELEKRGVPENHMPEPTQLSVHSTLACSYYNQGCQGGFPFLIAKHATEFGIPELKNQAYGTAGQGKVGQCDPDHYKDEKQLTFAKDYSYVQGFYGKCGQAAMMSNLVKYGPLVVAFEVPPHFSGHDIVGSSFLQTPERLAKNPETHSRLAMDKAASFLEATWGVKTDSHCTAPSTVAMSNVHEAMKQWVPDGYIPHANGQGFSLDTSKIPQSVSHPYTEAKKVLSSALQLNEKTEDCLHLQLVPLGMNNWEFTNHAVVVVGYGQQDVHPSAKSASLLQSDGNSDDLAHTNERAKEPHKYWIIRNSWGPSFADHGHILVARGVDLGGLESQAVHVEPDLTRGLMKEKLDHYSQFATNPESSAKSVSSARRTALLDLESRVTRSHVD